MPPTGIAKPRSIKRRRKYGSISVHASKARARKIQSLLVDSCNCTSNDVDVLICIPGVDSRYRESMQECVDYLTFGLYASESSNLQGVDDDDVMDDLILCIRKNQIDVYCNPINYTTLVRFIAPWDNLRIHCLSREKYVDSDLAEEFKIKTFISMMCGAKRVGVPYFSLTQKAQAFDKMNLEQWPLIQAFALEDCGGQTFFTLQYDIVDVSDQLATIYPQLDAVATEKFVEEMLPLFERQWGNFSRTVDVARQTSLLQLTEQTAAESLITYYNHGNIGRQVKTTPETLWEAPFLLFGKRTNQIVIGNICPEPCTIESAGCNGAPAVHMIVHGVCPKTHLACTRTYFFENSALPGFPGDSEANIINQDVEQLAKAYRVAVEVTLKGIAEFTTSLNADQIIASARKNVVSGLQKSFDCRRLCVSIELLCRDGAGKLVDIKDKISSNTILFLSVLIKNIASVDNPEAILGAVAYSESFITSSLITAQENDEKVLHCENLVLTSNIPVWLTWTHSENALELAKRVENISSQGGIPTVTGETLIDGQPVELVAPHAWLQPIKCKLYMFESAVMLCSAAFGALCVDKEDIKSVDFYDSKKGEYSPSFVVLYTSMSFQSQIPHQLHNTARMLIISLYAKSKAHKLFFEKVFGSHRKENSIHLTIRDKLPESLQPVYDALSLKHEADFLGSRDDGSSSTLSGLVRYMQHASVSSAVQGQTVMKADVPVLLSSAAAEGVAASQEPPVLLIITILAGIPGCHKETVCSYITQLTQERSRWVIHNQTPETSHAFDRHKLESSLSYIYSVLRKKATAASKTSRMLVITPGYTDLREVIQTIALHPNEELRRHIKIGAVSTCVDPLNTFITGKYTLPQLLEQCSIGWVNNIILTSSTDVKNEELAEVQDMIRAVNPDVAFILADRGEITRSADIDLILSDSAFSANSLEQSRLLSYPTWRRERMPLVEHWPVLSTIVLRFKQSLEKQLLVSNLMELKSRVGFYPFNGAVLSICGRCRFTRVSGLFEISHATLSQVTRIDPTKKEDSTDEFFSFTGYALVEQELKSFLQACAPQKPKLRKPLRREDLDKSTLEAIHKEMHLLPLPPGWFYNGTQYIDMLGEKLARHPLFDEYVKDYIKSENEKIVQANKQIDEANYCGLFE